MTELAILDQAIITLRRNIANFPVGALSSYDNQPVGEKIANMRKCLKRLNARSLTLKVEKDAQASANLPARGNLEGTFDRLEEATTDALLLARTVELCLHSHALQTRLSANKDKKEMPGSLQSYVLKFFALNDSMVKLQTLTEELYEKQLDLKVHCQKSLFEYQEFIKEQKRLQNEKLQETNPEIVLTKNKMYDTLRKINVMKRLVTNFIAASGHMLIIEPMLIDMLEKHRELISVESILKMIPNSSGEL